jgi:uncharacterized membrane protein YdjX (TVP38/TMEM64 family)
MPSADPKPPSAADSASPGKPPRVGAALLVKDLGAAGPLAVVSAVMPALGGFAILGTLHIVGPWLASHQIAGVALYVTAFAVLSGLALLPTYAQAVLGGWAFGFAVGAPAAMGGFVGGALIAYALARRVASDDVERVLAKRPQWLAVRNELVGGGFWKTLGIVTLLRIPLNSPFALTNLVLSASRTPLLPYALGTLIGMTPRTAGAVWVAAHIQGELTSETVRASRPDWFLPVAIGSVLVVFFIITQLANRAIKRVSASNEAGPSDTLPS